MVNRQASPSTRAAAFGNPTPARGRPPRFVVSGANPTEPVCDDLQRRPGVANIAFTDPYGGREHVNSSRLYVAKEVGHQGCLSALRGPNLSEVGQQDGLRRGIHWSFSGRAFLLGCLGLR
jgi:hypothetical protein